MRFRTRCFRRCAELDGRSALAYALDNSLPWQLEAAVAAALGGWAGNGPDGAWRWGRGQSGEGHFQGSRLNAMIARVAESEISIDLSLAQSVTNEGLRSGALKTIANRILARTVFVPSCIGLLICPMGRERTS